MKSTWIFFAAIFSYACSLRYGLNKFTLQLKINPAAFASEVSWSYVPKQQQHPFSSFPQYSCLTVQGEVCYTMCFGDAFAASDRPSGLKLFFWDITNA